MSINLVDGPVVLAGATDGVAVVPSPNPLSRLNFFDGRLLRGGDLTVEQDAERQLDLLVASASGSGVAWGLDVDRSGEVLSVSAGLAFDPQGRPLLLPSDVQVAIADLLGADAVSSDPGDATGTSAFAPCVLGLPVEVTTDPVSAYAAYLLTIGWVEGLCGTMDVYGAACDQACVGTTNRPYRVDGVVFRLRPVQLTEALPTSQVVTLSTTHLRSRLAAAYFATERAAGPLLSAAALSDAAWCRGGTAPGGVEVPLAMVVRFGQHTGFHDEWVARRERLEPPARTGFDLRMQMRPRAVWDAQVAQFQCQLADRIGTGGLPSGPRRLVDGGIVELPPCGYLPIDQNADVVAQVTAMMGPGVDLRFVPVPVDAIPHELEIVQHRDRISLLTGLDRAAGPVPVDILVPGGGSGRATSTDQLFRSQVAVQSDGEPLTFRGVGRLAPRGTGFTLSVAGMAGVTSLSGAREFVTSARAKLLGAEEPVHRINGSSVPIALDPLRPVANDMRVYSSRVQAQERAPRPFARYARADAKPIAGRVVLTVDRDPWELDLADAAFVHVSAEVITPVEEPQAASVDIVGQLTATELSRNGATRSFRLRGQLATTEGDGTTDQSTVDIEATVERVPGGADQPTQYRLSGVEDVVRTMEVGGGPFRIAGGGGSSEDRAVLVEDPRVADPNSAYRRLADMALQLLQGARPTDPQFLERAKLNAFGAGLVHGTTMSAGADWVAFRRRPPEPTVPAPARTVAVWVTATAGEREAARAYKLLLSGNGGQLEWKQVANAGFDAATDALLTSPLDLQNGYAETGAGSEVRFVGWAPVSMTSGTVRSSEIVSALAPVAALDPNGAIGSLPRPPADYMDPDTDGSVFLIAYPQVQTEKLLQVVGRSGDVDLERLKQLLAEPTRKNLEVELGSGRLRDLGQISFAGDQPVESEYSAVESAYVGELNGWARFDGYPQLWLDERWFGEHKDLLEPVIGVANRLVEAAPGFDGQVPQLQWRRVPGIGTSPPAVLADAGVPTPL